MWSTHGHTYVWRPKWETFAVSVFQPIEKIEGKVRKIWQQMLSQKCKNHKNSNKMVTIQLLEYPIPPPPPPALHHKKSEWRYLGNEKSYQRSAGVYYDWKNSKYKKISKKKVKKIWLFLDFSVISRTHYPIIAPLRGSRSLSARRAWRTLSSRPGGAPRRALRPWDPRNATMIWGMTWKSDCKKIHTLPQINRC